MLEQLQGLHIELTNMCTLKCPKCARTDFINRFPNQWTNKNLNLENLISFLDIDLRGLDILLCGNYGDAIYYDRLFDAVAYFKQSNANITIATNGSYKSVEWWHQLGQLLDSNDKIIFAIDGTPDNFTKYRINADWQSIEQAITTLKKYKVKLSWQYILFSYNKDCVDVAQELSEKLGFDEFLVLESNRWDSNEKELLNPENDVPINTSKINWKSGIKPSEINPKCTTDHTEHYISADGYYMPCCYVGDHRFYYKSEFFKNQSYYDISKNTISKILSSTRSIDFYNSLKDVKLNYCTFNCPKL